MDNPLVIALLQTLLQVLLPILITGLVTLGGILAAQLVAHLRTRLGTEKWAFIENLVATAVRAAEQSLHLTTPEAKRAFAMQVCDYLFTQFKIKLSGELVVALIEAVLAKEKLAGLDYVRKPIQFTRTVSPAP